MADVFISYASEDRSRVQPLVEALQREGLSVWWDRRIDIGSSFDREIERELSSAPCVVVVWSAVSVESDWVREEADEGLRRGVLVPVQIDDCQLPLGFRRTQAAQLIGWPKDPERIVELKRKVFDLVGKPASTVPSDAPDAPAPQRRWVTMLAAAAAVAAIGIALAWWLDARRQTADEAWIREVALPALDEATNAIDTFLAAEQLAAAAPDHEALRNQWSTFSLTVDIRSEPAGADVAVSFTLGDSAPEWRELGRTPIDGVRVPRSGLRWRVTASSYRTLHALRIGGPPFLNHATMNFVLTPADGDDVVAVTSALFHPVQTGRLLNELINFPDYHIARREVINADFKVFVDAGGYSNPDFWSDLVFIDGTTKLDWQQAVTRFVDTTGRPGPSTWEIGSYPAGQGDFPVGGVSWFEAIAYARFRGGDLPTIYHWAVAAQPIYQWQVAPLSNFSNKPMAAGSLPSFGPFGTVDMAGNVREWTINAYRDDTRWVVGGSFNEPEYTFSEKHAIPAFDRNPTNGIRLAFYDEPFDGKLRAPFLLTTRDNRLLEPVTDDIFEVLKEQFADRGVSLDPRVEQVIEENDYRVERVTVTSDVADERLILNLYLPARSVTPHQAVVFFPASFALSKTPSLHAIKQHYARQALQLVINTGRAFVLPVYWGTYERFTPARDIYSVENLEAGLFAEALVHWASDIKRTIDYLETRADIDAESIGYIGASMGACRSVPILAIEDRFKVAVLWSGGLPYRGWVQYPTLADPINYLTRISIPVLMLNGEYDTTFPRVTSQEPMWRLLDDGTDRRRYIVYPKASHGLPRGQILRDTADWLDRFLPPS